MSNDYTSRALKLLLIDDDEINNFIGTKIIRKAITDIEITTCLNGKVAIDTLVATQSGDRDAMPDYILLDTSMPVMNGWEFLDEYKRLNLDPLAKIKIFIISSSVFSNDVEKLKHYPFVSGFVPKPFDLKKIAAILTSTI